jgi:antitoxin (DNA-binding transcriptional repressor) of toxin-antitoxin stability system
MPVINARELARHSAQVLTSVVASRRAALVTRGGKPVAAIVPVDSAALEDWILANAPEFVRGMSQADKEFAGGQTISLEAFLGTLPPSAARTPLRRVSSRALRVGAAATSRRKLAKRRR